jgi:DNA (cytosine-5)-methyltransferase 1
MTHASLFSGIGGFDLAADWMGWENLFHCEWNPFGQKVLKHHFPNSISYNDITKTDFSIHRGQVDILTGGFPCQPYSQAGKRLGKEDERHLWPEMLRTIQEVQPRWVVGENVLGLTNWNGGLVFEEVQTDLEAKGYEVQAYVLPAAGVNAPHRRDRIFFIAYSKLHKNKYTNNGGSKQEEGNLRRKDKGNVFNSYDSNGFATNSNLYGQQQKWGYDRSSKNADGSNDEEFWSTNSKEFDRCNTYRDTERKSELDNRTFKEGIYKEDTTSNTTGICRMDKDNRKSKTSCGENKLEDDKSRTLVQNGQSGFQLPINGGLEYIKGTFSSTRMVRSQDDISRINRMEGNAANSNIIGQECREKGESTKTRTQSNDEQFERCNKLHRGNFEMFPSKPPICGGDDGLPRELDSITFSKWRNESLKAYGNAIVPQVAFEIFKAIEKFELMVNK